MGEMLKPEGALRDYMVDLCSKDDFECYERTLKEMHPDLTEEEIRKMALEDQNNSFDMAKKQRDVQA